MIEMLARGNNVLWISPYGNFKGSLMPHFNRVRNNLGVYHPGVNWLPLQFLNRLNERRRQMQVYLYLLQEEFRADLIWTDDPGSVRLVERYRNEGVPAFFFADRHLGLERSEIQKLGNGFDLVAVTSEKLLRDFASGEKVFLTPGSSSRIDHSLSLEEQEEALIEDLENRLEEISGRLEKLIN